MGLGKDFLIADVTNHTHELLRSENWCSKTHKYVNEQTWGLKMYTKTEKGTIFASDCIEPHFIREDGSNAPLYKHKPPTPHVQPTASQSKASSAALGNIGAWGNAHTFAAAVAAAGGVGATAPTRGGCGVN